MAGITKAKPNAIPTPLKKQEPTIQQTGTTPEAALAKDKSSVRKPVDPQS